MPDRENREGALARRPSGAFGRPRGFGGWDWDPWREMAEMRRRMDDLFTGFFGAGFGMPSAPFRDQDFRDVEPDVDLFEDDREYVVYAALPGVKPEDIRLEATDNSINLTAEYRSAWGGEGTEAGREAGAGEARRPLKQSRYSRQGSFQFSYTFPADIRPDESRAEFVNGRLELYLPKAQDDTSMRARQIPVNTAGGALPAGAPKLTAQESGARQAKPPVQKTQQPGKKAA